MKTAMQELEDWVNNHQEPIFGMDLEIKINELLKKEKEQIKKSFSDGQETPLNNTNIPHYSCDEYYNDNYNQNK